MIDTLMTMWNNIYKNFSSVADFLTKEYTVLNFSFTLYEVFFGGLLLTFIGFKVVKFFTDVIL